MTSPVELINKAIFFHQQGYFDEAEAIYKKVLHVHAKNFDALHMLGIINAQRGLFDEAEKLVRKALSVDSKIAQCFHNYGTILAKLQRFEEAVSNYNKAINLAPNQAPIYADLGIALNILKRYEEAIAVYDKILSLEPNFTGVEGARLHAKMHLCDWNNFDTECSHLISSVRNGKGNTLPFQILAIPSTSNDQLRCAKQHITNNFLLSEKPIWQGERYNHDRIRVAYVSADFRQHPVSLLMAGMFECHDKSRFDVTAISFGPDDNSEMRQRLKASFERFIDAETYSDSQIANLVKELEIDILVDLMGFTTDSRPGIFARRSAPIQVHYLSYAGTMGAEYMDYIIADRIVIPEGQDEFYSEKIVFLPNSYLPTSFQINDARRSITNGAFTRSELGLPRTGFVFCCFNNNYKITPHIFSSWMRILKKVEDSVLWLFEGNSTISTNLKKEAEARGVNADRLIFAKWMPRPEYLARHRCADLFIDTLPYNAHATVSDALWTGLPVLTCLGETFSGRVAASLLNAIRLPELITTTLEDYERLAIELATNAEKLARIKRRLAGNRLTTPLFDTKLSSKHIEAAYTVMYERHQVGLPPDHIIIPNS